MSIHYYTEVIRAALLIASHGDFRAGRKDVYASLAEVALDLHNNQVHMLSITTLTPPKGLTLTALSLTFLAHLFVVFISECVYSEK